MNMVLRKNEALVGVLADVLNVELVSFTKTYLIDNTLYRDNYAVYPVVDDEGDVINKHLKVNTFSTDNFPINSKDLLLREVNYDIIYNKNNLLKIVSDKHEEQCYQTLDEAGNIVHIKYSFIDTIKTPIKVTREETIHRNEYNLIDSYEVKEFHDGVLMNTNLYEFFYKSNRYGCIDKIKEVITDNLSSESKTNIISVIYNDYENNIIDVIDYDEDDIGLAFHYDDKLIKVTKFDFNAPMDEDVSTRFCFKMK